MTTTSHPRLDITLVGDRTLQMERHFAAPPALVFDAHIRPELLKRWLSARLPLEVCEVDARPGGAWRYVWRHRDGSEMGAGGTFLVVEPPHRLVHTELFDDDWTGGPVEVTTLFHADGDGTRMEMIAVYTSEAARAGALRTGMADGMADSYADLDALLAG